MTQPDWAALAAPFDPEEVKQRPGAATWDHKSNCQGKTCRDTRDPNMHHQFDYVDARAVAQRLDDVLTPAGWQFTCHVLGGDVVAGHLAIRADDDLWIAREDHGYPNSDRDEEPIKAATSDALKRCAVLFGVGRHLYGNNTPNKRAPARTTHGAAAPPQTAAPSPTAGRGAPSPRPAASTVPPEPEGWMAPSAVETARTNGNGPGAPVGGITPGADEGTCPQHNKPWKENNRGFYCGTPLRKSDDGTKVLEWCDEKPTQRWVSSRAAVGAGR